MIFYLQANLALKESLLAKSKSSSGSKACQCKLALGPPWSFGQIRRGAFGKRLRRARSISARSSAIGTRVFLTIFGFRIVVDDVKHFVFEIQSP
jgi:hypothetical protein